MKKISIIGHFAFGANVFDGQTVKTQTVTKELEKRFGSEEVVKFDTHGSKIKSIIKSPFQALKALNFSSNAVIFPAQNGLRIFAPLLVFFKKFFKGRKLHYVVIGGWLSEFLKGKPILSERLKKIDFIYVETSTMKKALEEQGFCNVVVMPNFKDLKILEPSDLIYSTGEPHKLCTFSRVMKEKGIEDAVNAVKSANEKIGRTVYTLDIYGQVEKDQTEWFENLKTSFPDHVKYCGVVDFEKSVDVLKNYYALLFPTHFYTEGIPGTIIDAFAAGVPVISSKWESFNDIVDDSIDGIGYDFYDRDELANILAGLATAPDRIEQMKPNCIEKARKYLPENAIGILVQKLLIQKPEENK